MTGKHAQMDSPALHWYRYLFPAKEELLEASWVARLHDTSD